MSRVDGRGKAELVRSEEELDVHLDERTAGAVRARKHVETERVEQLVDRGIEHAGVEREAPVEGDSGQIETLPDGSISIPVFEEQLVVEKRLVVRERVVVRKTTVYEEEVVSAEVRRERLEVETEGDVRVHDDGAAR